MGSFCQNLIFISIFSSIIKIFLPKGEKSALYPPLKFLLSLALILCVFTPLMIKTPIEDFHFDFNLPEINSTPSGEELILTKMEENMRKTIRASFPDADFSLLIYRDENNLPGTIGVICEKKEEAERIANFILKNYRLETKVI